MVGGCNEISLEFPLNWNLNFILFLDSSLSFQYFSRNDSEPTLFKTRNMRSQYSVIPVDSNAVFESFLVFIAMHYAHLLLNLLKKSKSDEFLRSNNNPCYQQTSA